MAWLFTGFKQTDRQLDKYILDAMFGVFSELTFLAS
jgi:hypothetical protein